MDAFNSLSLVAKDVSELMWLAAPANAYEAEPRAILSPVLEAVWQRVVPADLPDPDGRDCRVCGLIRELGPEDLILEAAAAEQLLQNDDDRENDKPSGANLDAPRKKTRREASFDRLILKPRRDAEQEDPPRLHVGAVRTPEVVEDTRFTAALSRARFRCDRCGTVSRGRRTGTFTSEARQYPRCELGYRWRRGEVDASWYCTSCWMELLGAASIAETEKVIGTNRLQDERLPRLIPDHRFYDKSFRWFRCDVCANSFNASSRNENYGSFIYARDGHLAGPPRQRGLCFPLFRDIRREWANCEWRADWACVNCLVGIWHQPRQAICDWIAMHPNQQRGARTSNQRTERRPRDDERRALHLQESPFTREQRIDYRDQVQHDAYARRAAGHTRGRQQPRADHHQEAVAHQRARRSQIHQQQQQGRHDQHWQHRGWQDQGWQDQGWQGQDWHGQDWQGQQWHGWWQGWWEDQPRNWYGR